MFNKKRIVIFVGFLCCLFFMTTFAGAPAQNTIIATRSVEFVDGYNDRTISEQTIEVGTDAEVPSDPEHDGYIFAGWYLFDDQDVRVTDFTNVLNDLKVIAKYQGDANRNGIADENEPRYTVTFIDSIGGNVLATVEVLTGTSATAPTVPTHDGYTFTGWDRSYSNVTGNITVRTVYTTTNTTPTTDEPEENYYNVVFIDTLTNRVIDSVRIAEGLTASTPETPTHEGYLFVRWDGDFTNVNSDREIYTVYVRDENNNGVDDTTETRYTVTFDAKENGLIILEDGTTRNTLTINNILTGTEFGNAISKLPEVLANEYYIVDGWNETIPTEDFLIEENMIFTAKYLEDKNNNGTADDDETLLVVTFYDTIENKALKTEEVLPGLSATAPTPKEYNKKLFTGWDEEFTNVTENITVNTIYVDDVNNNGVDDSKEQDTKKTLTIEYVSIKPNTNPVEYNKLADSKEVELLPGETRVFFANDVRIDYYTLNENQAFDGITVTMPNEDTTIRFIYTPGEDKNNDGIADKDQNLHTLTINHIGYTTDGNETILKTETVEYLLENSTYEIKTKPYIEYVFDEAKTKDLTVIMPNSDYTFNVYYKGIEKEVRLNYNIIENNQVINKSETKMILIGSTLENKIDLSNITKSYEFEGYKYTFNGWKINDMKITNEELSNLHIESNIELYADYTKTPLNYKLTINYNFIENPNNLDNKYEDIISYGEEYSVTSPVIEGYVATPRIVSGIMDTKDIIVDVNYLPTKPTLNVTKENGYKETIKLEITANAYTDEDLYKNNIIEKYFVNGVETTNEYEITENGEYIIKVEDSFGQTNETTITINTIDKTLPIIKVNGKIDLSIKVAGNNKRFTYIPYEIEEENVETLNYARGKYETVEEYKNNASDKIALTNKNGNIEVSTDGFYTIYVKDKAGHETIQIIEVSNTKENYSSSGAAKTLKTLDELLEAKFHTINLFENPAEREVNIKAKNKNVKIIEVKYEYVKNNDSRNNKYDISYFRYGKGIVENNPDKFYIKGKNNIYSIYVKYEINGVIKDEMFYADLI